MLEDTEKGPQFHFLLMLFMCLPQRAQRHPVIHQCFKMSCTVHCFELDDNKGIMKYKSVDGSFILFYLKFYLFFLVYVYITVSIAERLPYSICFQGRAVL